MSADETKPIEGWEDFWEREAMAHAARADKKALYIRSLELAITEYMTLFSPVAHNQRQEAARVRLHQLLHGADPPASAKGEG